MLLVIIFLFYTVGSSGVDSAVIPRAPKLIQFCGGNISAAIETSDPGVCVEINQRTVTDILWSCLATIFACTWVAVHPNIPGPRQSEWQRFLRRCSTMIYAIIAPEMVTLWAMRQRYAAARIKADYNTANYQHDRSHRSPWRVVGEYFWGPDEADEMLWTLTHGFFIQQGGFVLIQEDYPPFVLNYQQLQMMIDGGIVDHPSVTEDDILDKSKGDFLSKLLVVIQTTWFTIQCVGRWVAHLPVTELEVVTLAFAVLNIVTYSLWWKKGQTIQTPIHITKKPGAPRQEVPPLVERRGWLHRKFDELKEDGGDAGHLIAWMVLITLLLPLKLVRGVFTPLGKMATENTIPHAAIQIPEFYADLDITEQTEIILPALLTSVVFGAIHTVAWNSSFSNPTEQLLWRVCAAVIAIEPLPAAICIALIQMSEGRRFRSAVRMVVDAVTLSLGCVGFICLPLYVVARLVLLILAFATLRHLPADALQDISWSSFLPHI